MQHESTSLSQILEIAASESPPREAWQQLETWELADKLRAKAFGIETENLTEALKARLHLLHSIYPDIIQFCQTKGIKQHATVIETLWNLWLPLAMQVQAYRQNLQRPLIQGILGGQGTGKTTLAAILTIILKQLGYRTLSISLDDLYKTYAERLALKEQDPRLIWRGPPGTHDIELGIKVLDQLRVADGKLAPFNLQSEICNLKYIEVPRFDKSAWGGAGDRTTPEIVQNIDIVLFEGWFVGVRPIDPSAFDNAPPPILTADDRAFARDMNASLQDYLPLWERLDRLIVLLPSDYRLSQQWRRQAEQQTIKAGLSGMNDETVDRFVEYFWRALHPELFIKPMTKNAQWVDLVIEIPPSRSFSLVYRPGDRLPRNWVESLPLPGGLFS